MVIREYGTENIRYLVFFQGRGESWQEFLPAVKYLPQIEVIRIPHMMHGEYVLMHPEEFTEKAMEFFQ